MILKLFKYSRRIKRHPISDVFFNTYYGLFYK